MADESQQSTGRILTRDPSPVQVVADRTDDGAYEISVRPSADGGEASAAPAAWPEDDAASPRSSLPWRPAAYVVGAAVVILGIAIAQRSTPPGPEAAAITPDLVEEESSFRVYRVDPVQLQPATRFVLGERVGDEVDAGETPDTYTMEEYEPSVEPGIGSVEEEAPVDFAPRDWSPPPSGLQRAVQPPALRSPEAQSEAVLRSTMAGQLERVPVHVERILIDPLPEDDEFEAFDELDELDEPEAFDDDLP